MTRFMKKGLVPLAVATMLMMGSITVCAADNATVTFTSNNEITYGNVSTGTDGSITVSESFEGIAPGESAQQVITLTNQNSRTADFYMDASVIEALEQNAANARGAGYDVTLKAGNTTLYSSTVGGYTLAGEGIMEGSVSGLAEIQAALEGYTLVGTLANGESVNIILSITLDGEGMDNGAMNVDYSNVVGAMGFSFQVAYEDPAGPAVVYRRITRKGATQYVTQILDEATPLAAVKTGDTALIGFGVAVLIAGVVMVVISGKKKKEEKSCE